MATQVLRPDHSLQPRRKSSEKTTPEPQRRSPPRKHSPKPAKGAALERSPGQAAEVYAGSAFANSPAPSALPLPRFSLKKGAPAMGEYLATVALKRMLRVE
ncbi:hypothetical protein ZIOFF_018992 [Zingiber officinale]|uniref:Uncharacterized protein n=1 Tax=Zingiber officinale TaxID=94328 RepID=A0A8J5H6Y6_ZINOF|nr:hypothetical protein ZIOFF_018992 [Zingiber officinale]